MIRTITRMVTLRQAIFQSIGFLIMCSDLQMLRNQFFNFFFLHFRTSFKSFKIILPKYQIELQKIVVVMGIER